MPGTVFSTANWTGYAEASVQAAYQPASTITDFSFLIDLSELPASFGSNVQSDGGDIRLTDGSDAEVPFDLINFVYNSGSPTGLLRVKDDSVAAGTTLRVWAGYTGGTAVAYDANETYGSDNAYDTSRNAAAPLISDFLDRTSNSNDGTAAGGLAAGGASGPSGIGGTLFDGAGDEVDFGIGPVPTLSAEWTVSCWANRDVSATNPALFSFSEATQFVSLVSQGGVIKIASQGQTPGTGSAWPTAWSHFVLRWNGSQLQAFLNGALDYSVTPTGVFWQTATDFIAGGSVSFNTWKGGIADVSVDATDRSNAWIEHDYNQTNDNAAFWGTWTWSAAGGANIPAFMHHYRQLAGA